mgnify:CR=1 FL=1
MNLQGKLDLFYWFLMFLCDYWTVFGYLGLVFDNSLLCIAILLGQYRVTLAEYDLVVNRWLMKHHIKPKNE